MAKPIKETPVLKGNAAVRFMREIEKNSSHKASERELKQINESFKRIAAYAR